MGFKNGRWVSISVLNQLDYPFHIAAKLGGERTKGCTREEISEFINAAKKFYELCEEQDVTIRRLEQELKIAESTVRLLQVDNNTSIFGFWFDKKTHPPKREKGQKILAYAGYIFEAECDEDGHWCSIGGDDFTHWMPYIGEP